MSFHDLYRFLLIGLILLVLAVVDYVEKKARE